MVIDPVAEKNYDSDREINELIEDVSSKAWIEELYHDLSGETEDLDRNLSGLDHALENYYSES
ncbi:MAG: hypothetical protein ACI8Z7_000442 [Candidatus Nanohaloarchaea archaeon]|jgi:hypothetical protein